MHLDAVLIIISMQCTFITATHILTRFLYCTIPDHIDGTVIQHATNNVDAHTHCAYVFLSMKAIFTVLLLMLIMYVES